MKRWKRGAAMLLCLCMMAALLAGCGRGRSGENTASVVMTGSVSTVDPAYAATPAERTLVLHLFDNLYRWTAEGAVPAAAHTYDCTDNEDGTQTYTFHLRRDGKWSDGSDVTAEDFVYAWRRLTAPETDSQEAEILSMVAGYEDAHAGDPEALGVYAEDEHTFVVTLSTMCPYFVDAVCTAAATMPVQQKAVEGGEGWSASRTWFVGNGPYRRTGDWSDSLFATLVKQEDHYNARQVRADRIEIRFKSAAEAAKDAGTAFVFMGHGTAHVAKVTYSQMQTQMQNLGYENVFIGTVEGEPEETACENVIEAVKAAGYTKVVLRPLMVVAGDHANNDMAGDDEDSWKSQFEASGEFDSVECQIAGLGEVADIQQLYVAHTKAAVDSLNG